MTPGASGLARAPIAIGNGRDAAVFHPDPGSRAAVRVALGVPEDRVVVVIVSRLVRHKGHPELLAAMAAVPEAELWVVGDRLASDHGEDLEPIFATSGLGARLRRLGYREDTPAVLAAADIFALPSHFEGLPMSVIEAMLTGLPVVATAIRGPREQVVDGETGLLVPPRAVEPLAAALRRLVADPALRASMGWRRAWRGPESGSTRRGSSAAPSTSWRRSSPKRLRIDIQCNLE